MNIFRPVWLARQTKTSLVLGLLLGSLAAQADARDGTVWTNDNRTLQGDIVAQDDQGVSIMVGGIRTLIAASNIREVRYQEEIQQEYDKRRASIDSADLPARYSLAYWLFEQKAYALATSELQDMQKVITEKTPEDQRNKIDLLSRIVIERQKLDQTASSNKAASASATAKPTTPGTAVKKPTTPPGSNLRLPSLDNRLTDKDINLIRLLEIDSNVPQPVIVPREVIDTLFAKYASVKEVPKGNEAQLAFRGLSHFEQLMVIFAAQARELYPKVTVPNDPPVMATFRANGPHQYVLNYCATNSCHGGPNSGELFIYRTDANTNRTVYTNFYILNQYVSSKGRMIDRDQPDKSLLVQYGLPRSQAVVQHPDVPGWRAEFGNEPDSRHDSLVAWIQSLYQPAPNYGIEFISPTPLPADSKPKTPGTTTKPATQPAATPANAKNR